MRNEEVCKQLMTNGHTVITISTETDTDTNIDIMSGCKIWIIEKESKIKSIKVGFYFLFPPLPNIELLYFMELRNMKLVF